MKKPIQKKQIPALLLSLTLGLSLLSGCGGAAAPAETEAPGPTPTAAPTAAPAPSPTPEVRITPEPTPSPTPEPEPETVYRSPFTGEILDAPMTERPFLFVINNHPEAQPQHGVGQADVIYEAPTEGSITRMQALFSDIRSVGFIGSVRSMRSFYLHTGLSYGAVLGHAGGSEESYDRIVGEHLDNVDGVRGSYGFAPFFRDPKRMLKGWEHAMFTTGQEVWDIAEMQGYPLTLPEDYDCGLRFSQDGAAPEGEDAAEVVAWFTNWKTTRLIYDPAEGRYFAWQEMSGIPGADYYDANTGETVWFDNVLLLSVRTEFLDNMGHRTMYFTEGGPGVWACGGKAAEITWYQEEDDGPFRYFLADGSEVPLRPGRTYIGLVPNADSMIPGRYEVLAEQVTEAAPAEHPVEEITVGTYQQ